MKELKEHSSVFDVIDLGRKEQLTLIKQANGSRKITEETALIIFLAPTEEAPKGRTMLVSDAGQAEIINQPPSQLLAKLDQESLHSQAEKIYIINTFLPSRYQNPHISGVGIFVPFDGPSKEETDWYNILLIRQVKKYQDKETKSNGAEIRFKAGLSLRLPRGVTAVWEKIKDSLNRGHYYFKLYDQVLIADNQKPTLTLPLIEKSLSELNLSSYLIPSEGMFQKSLVFFRKTEWLAHLAIVEEVTTWQ